MIKYIKSVTRQWRNIPPHEYWLKRIYESDYRWVDYQAWLYRYNFMSQSDWINQRTLIRRSFDKKIISILTPVYNVSANYLWECVESLFFQTYPYWELILVDDCSTKSETVDLLRRLQGFDKRIKVIFQKKNRGICLTTNRALSHAEGEFAIFLDHDDKLSPDALYEVANALRQKPDSDVIYSDRDMISEKGVRYMHLFKPGWAPETILTSNYLCHLTAYRRALLESLGGLQQDTEGSQDHDLILRAQETSPNVTHIPKILYHWRQHTESVSLNPESKEYAYKAAIRSVEKALERRGLEGKVEEISGLWRGNYRVKLQPPPLDGVYLHFYSFSDELDFAQTIGDAVNKAGNNPFIIFSDKALEPVEKDWMEELVSWFKIDGVSLVTGKILDNRKRIIHAGLIINENSFVESVYYGLNDSETPGYMAWAATAHNISFAHPACFALRREEAIDILHQFERKRGVLDFYSFCLCYRSLGRRIVYTPFAKFVTSDENIERVGLIRVDCKELKKSYGGLITKRDPYFSRNIAVSPEGVSLNFSTPPF